MTPALPGYGVRAAALAAALAMLGGAPAAAELVCSPPSMSDGRNQHAPPGLLVSAAIDFIFKSNGENSMDLGTDPRLTDVKWSTTEYAYPDESIGVVEGMSVTVRSAQRLIEQMQSQTQTFALLLAAIGSISLIVGGVGVMNVMLVSVTERRKEIGIRRALGARRLDIQSQFLIESVVLSLIGGVFGILFGVGGTWLFCHFSGWTFLVDPTAAALGFVVAFLVGVFFGLQPAHQAARLDPIAALRSV